MEKHSVKFDLETLGMILGHKVALEKWKSLGNITFDIDRENKTITYHIDSDDDSISDKMLHLIIKP